MSINTTLNITVTTSGEGIAPPAKFSREYANQSATVGGKYPQVLAADIDVTIPIPAGQIGVIIEPSTLSTVAKRLKNVAGDSGLPIAKNKPTQIYFDGQASFVLRAVAVEETISLFWL